MIDAKKVMEELARGIGCLRSEGLEDEVLDLPSWNEYSNTANGLVSQTTVCIAKDGHHRFLIQVIDLDNGT